MRTTSHEDRNFISAIISSSLLEDAIDFITSTYTAEELYGKEVLEEWAEENGYVKEEE